MLPYRSNDICIIKSIETNRSKRRLAYKLFRYPISRQRSVKILFLVLIVCARRNCENSKKRERKGKRNLVFLFEKSYFSPLYHESTYSNNRSIDLFSHFVQPPPIHKSIPVSSLVARDNWARLPMGTDWYDGDTPIANPICVSLI